MSDSGRNDIFRGLGRGLLFAGPVAGSVVGDDLYAETRPAGQPRSISLFDLHPTDGLSLGLPAIGFIKKDDETRVQISVLSGPF